MRTLLGFLALVTLPAAPLGGQTLPNPIPDAWEAACWRSVPCQGASHVAIHAAPVLALDALGVNRKAAMWASASWAVLHEALDVRRHVRACGSPWCGETLGALDIPVDLGTRLLGAWLGYRLARALGGGS